MTTEPTTRNGWIERAYQRLDEGATTAALDCLRFSRNEPDQQRLSSHDLLLEFIAWFADNPARGVDIFEDPLAAMLAVNTFLAAIGEDAREATMSRAGGGDLAAEHEALAAGTHEPAVDDFGNQYLARLDAPEGGE